MKNKEIDVIPFQIRLLAFNNKHKLLVKIHLRQNGEFLSGKTGRFLNEYAKTINI